MSSSPYALTLNPNRHSTHAYRNFPSPLDTTERANLLNDRTRFGIAPPTLDSEAARKLLTSTVLEINKEKITYTGQPIQIETAPPPPPLPKFNLTLRPHRGEGSNWGRIFTWFYQDIAEDALWRKLLACIPVFGIIPTLVYEQSLRKQIQKTTDKDRMIKLITVKNNYKIVSIIRECLTIALAIAAVALNIFKLFYPAHFFCIEGFIIGFSAVCFYKNQQLIRHLQERADTTFVAKQF